MNFSNLVRQHWAALRALLVLTVDHRHRLPAVHLAGRADPGLHDKAEGSIVDASTESRSAAA